MGNSFNQEDQPEGRPIPLSPREALSYLKNGAAILDIRSENETNYRTFDFPNIYLLPSGSYREKFNEVPKDKPLIVVDNVGLESPKVAGFFLEHGYPDIAYIVGGVVEWDHDGLPLIKDFDYELHGACACMLKPQKRS